MPKKLEAAQPEMSQVYQNEFMFGEGGGKGATINSFLKSLSKSTAGRSTSSLSSQGTAKSVMADDPKIIGASFSHLNISSSQPKPKKSHSTTNLHSLHISQSTNSSDKKKKDKKSKSHPFQSNIYMDSDDDWDATVDNDSDVNLSNHNSFDLSHSELGLKIAGSQRNSLINKPGTGHVNDSTNAAGSTDVDNPLLKRDYQKIIEDPTYIMMVVSGPNLMKYDENMIDTSGAKEELNAFISRYNRFKRILLHEPTINLDELKKLSWNGIPNELKAIVWQLLSGYLSTNADRRSANLKRKRKEYLDQIANVMKNEKDSVTWHQITIDIPRTNPHIKLYSFPTIQRSLERILYLWAVRHPASGYVQGINDICTPFFQVFLSCYLKIDRQNCVDISEIDPSNIPEEVLNVVEADTYWCLTKLLDSIQDNYIHAQPGIIRQVNELKDLTNRIDSDLVKHLENEGIEFLQFSFRWMNCLLMRELNMNHIIRMWDTYLTEGSNGFSEFHIYVCAAFLVKWSDTIKQMDFQEIMIFLQSLPTKNWSDKDIELLLSEAYMWQTLYKNASAHLR
ncbi:GTPase-activating protein [Saccharomycopsis crataegensis]|uniref:GTPase-activating protein n=1 Tax=Saccharomycopsis crataegensis TaxID=43959 RepID=A0AAV5QF74_9ASCO|nr:GTPase-activating protein [Saccharomycopsis crataegensis]